MHRHGCRHAHTGRGLILLAPALLLAACAQTPMGPTVNVMPGPGKSFDAFQYDQASCKQFAEQSVAGQAQNANLRGLAVGVVGTALGAGLGGAIGGGSGAGIGAASGAIGGGALGAGSSANAQVGIQEQYNNAYSQCMYAHGNAVPGYGPMMVQSPAGGPPPGYRPSSGYPPPPGYQPPPGYPPPSSYQ